MKLGILDQSQLLLVGGVVVGVSGCVLGVFKYRAWKKKNQLRKKWDEAGKNVVVLHQFPRPGVIPNLSPFPIKLETFLRAMKIEYVSDFEAPMSEKGKSPWITVNGEDVTDSQLSVEFLTDMLEKDMDSHLTEEEAATARAFRIMIEDHLYWGLAVHRWVHDAGEYLDNFKSIFGPVPGFLVKRIRKQVGQTVGDQAKSAGVGRHTRMEIEKMCCKDLVAVSTLLGTKPYMMGDKPSLLDCTVFGSVCQILHGVPSTCVYRQLLETDLENLVRHFERMKGDFWGDWESIC